MRPVVLLVVLVLGLTVAPAHAVPRPPGGFLVEDEAAKYVHSDAADIAARTALRRPERQLLDEASVALEQGNAAVAAEILERALQRAPRNPLLRRRHCAALLAQGKREAAFGACYSAVDLRGTPADRRALTAVLMTGDGPPRSGDLIPAHVAAVRAAHLSPKEPWGYAAYCDVAWRLQDRPMLDFCRSKLLSVAPDHPETQRALARRLPPRFGPARVLGWLLVFCALLGTVVHAVWRLACRLIGHRRVVAAATGVVLTFALNPRALADEPSAPKWQIDDADPEANVPTQAEANQAPLAFGDYLMELTARGITAMERENPESAVKYFRALVKAVPDRSAGYSRLCEAYAKAGDLVQADEACFAAIRHPGAKTQDFRRALQLRVARRAELTDEEIEATKAIVVHLRDQGADPLLIAQSECDVASVLGDGAGMEACAATLNELAPDDPRTVTYSWALAVKHRRFFEARRLLQRAEQINVEPNSLDKMRAGTSALWRQMASSWGLAGVAIIAVLGLGVLGAFQLRRRVRPVSAAPVDPSRPGLADAQEQPADV